MRAGSIVGGLVVAALLLMVPDTGLFVMWKVVIPTPAAAVPDRPGPVAQPVPARGLQPDAARAQAHQGADGAGLAQGIRLRHRVQPVHHLHRPAQAGPRRQRRLLRAAAARRDGRGLHRRHLPQGQERLVQHDLPAAPGPAHLRPDAADAGRQRALPAVRRLRQELLRLQPARRLPGRPATTRTPTGAATASTSSARSRASCSASSPSRARSRWRSPSAVSLAVFATLTDLLQDERPHDHEPLRRRRVQHLLLVRRRRRDRPAHVGAPRRRRRARRDLVRAHAQARRSRSWRRPRRPRPPRRGPGRRASASPAPAACARSAPRSRSCPTTSASRPSRASRCWRSPRPTTCRSRPAAAWASAAPTRSRSRTA